MTSQSFQSSAWFCLVCTFVLAATFQSPAGAEDQPQPVKVPDAIAESPADMKAYAEPLAHTAFKIDMLPIPGGKFVMGSPDNRSRSSRRRRPAARSRSLAVLDEQVRDHMEPV